MAARAKDILTGGAGGDSFVFLPGDGTDRITEFDAGHDVIRFGVPGGNPADIICDDSDGAIHLTDHANVILLVGLSGLTLDALDSRYGFHISAARSQSFVNVFDFKGQGRASASPARSFESQAASLVKTEARAAFGPDPPVIPAQIFSLLHHPGPALHLPIHFGLNIPFLRSPPNRAPKP